ncbi:MAG: CehA/McbA family metallohydrolase [Armatimonadetes bacterium]|nr:CehA/McbA family metallohydrolase [Armatimonadota bacterium]
MQRRHALLILLALLVALALQGAGCAQELKPRIEVAAPADNAVLRGVTDVRVALADVPADSLSTTRAFVSLGGPPWVEMKREGEGNTWTVQFDTTAYPNGPAKMLFMAWGPKTKRLGMTALVTIQNGLQCYFADLHSHTSYSDGTLYPADAHLYAREVAKLDVFVLTDHLESVDDAEWADMREQAWKANEEGRFVSFPGLEWTKAYGHANIYDPAGRKFPNDFEGMWKAAAESGAIVKINHPFYPDPINGVNPWNNLAYSELADSVVELMEVRSTKEEEAYIQALKAGWHLAAEGSSDTHSPNWGNAGTWTGILAPSLTRRCIWEALRNRQVFSTRDRNCRLFLWVNGAPMGAIVETPAASVAVTVDVADPDAQESIAKIELYENGAVVATDEPKTAARRWEITRTPAAGKHFYFVRITQGDGNMIWSAPVWVTVGG